MVELGRMGGGGGRRGGLTHRMRKRAYRPQEELVGMGTQG